MGRVMKSLNEISIRDCRRALQWAWCRRSAGIPVKLNGRRVVIDQPLKVRGNKWFAGDRQLDRSDQVVLTAAARKIIAKKVAPLPSWCFPPEVSIAECHKAIAHAGKISLTLRGALRHITDLSPGPGSHWSSEDLRLTDKEKRLLTAAARDILRFEQFSRA